MSSRLILLVVCALSWTALDAHAAPKKSPPKKTAPARPPPPPPSPAPAPAASNAPRAVDAASPAARRENAEGAAEAGVLNRKGPTRVDFDDRLVQGQTTKQGAIYLFERKESALRSMLRKRENFRAEISNSIE